MPLIKNTLIFLDTGFFRNFKSDDQDYSDLLDLSRSDKIILCTSYICIEEWRSQKIKFLKNFLLTTEGEYRHQINANLIASDILRLNPLRYPDDEEIENRSLKIADKFVSYNNIIKYMPTEEHIPRTWNAYFKGLSPFKLIKNREDIPDSWIFEAVRDVRFNEVYKRYRNRFFIGGDKNLRKHISRLGLKPITVPELIALIKQEEEANTLSSINDVTEINNSSSIGDESSKKSEIEHSDLDSILNSAINDSMREIYLRLLGYTHWLDKPLKSELFKYIQKKEYPLNLIEAGAAILSQKSLNLIQDTGNYFLPLNKEVCEEAGNRVKTEIIEFISS